MITRRGRLLPAVALAAAFALAGCGASGGSGGATNEGRQYGPAAGQAQQGADQQGAAKPGAGQAENAGQPGNAAPAQYRREDRAIVYTGDLTVRVEDVDQAAARAGALAESAVASSPATSAPATRSSRRRT